MWAKERNAVTLFAAASLKPALDDIRATYVSAAEVDLVMVYGGSSALARQIQHGAPADLFISANVAWMDLLETQGLITPDSRINLLTNRLALIAAPGASVPKIEPGFDLAETLSDDQLAMALVDAVPAGIYGKTALQSLGVWSDVSTQLAQTDNVRAALNLVAIGQTPLGIVYASDAVNEPRVAVVGLFPETSHLPIRYPAALMANAAPEAGAFLDHLQSDAAMAIFASHGFLPMPEGQP